MFLWVTGRAMELGRECLDLWGYKFVQEFLWVKTNQLQRIIRTGRTGHWINHSKEHCLVGVKGKLADKLNLKDEDRRAAEQLLAYREVRPQRCSACCHSVANNSSSHRRVLSIRCYTLGAGCCLMV